MSRKMIFMTKEINICWRGVISEHSIMPLDNKLRISKKVISTPSEIYFSVKTNLMAALTDSIPQYQMRTEWSRVLPPVNH